GNTSQGQGINDLGWVVGYSYNDARESHATLWRDGKIVDLGTFGGDDSEAHDVNNGGQIVGYARALDRTASLPFIWEDGVMTRLPLLDDEPTFGATAKAINESGIVVGRSDGRIPGGGWFRHAVIWPDSTTVIELGYLG